jgi:hypothetical protein
MNITVARGMLTPQESVTVPYTLTVAAWAGKSEIAMKKERKSIVLIMHPNVNLPSIKLFPPVCQAPICIKMGVLYAKIVR